jgi:ribosomal protein L7Ae-like RNA K-turn-binding protein
VAFALGLCAKAGRLVCGTALICDALRLGRSGKTPLLVVAACDVSENTAKRLRDRCAYYNVPLAVAELGAEELGRAVGRSPLAAVGVTDENLAKLVRAKLDAAPQDERSMR